MSEIKYLSQEELAKANDLSDRYSRLVSEMGQNQIKQQEIKARLSELIKEETHIFSDYNTILTEEQALGQVLTEKYGEGVIDLQTGTITIA